MRWRIFSASRAEKNTLLVAVGNASVDVALARLSRRGSPTILLHAAAAFPSARKPTAESLRRTTVAALRESLSRIVRLASRYTQQGIARPQPIDDIAILFASPWYLPHAKLLQLRRPSPFTLSRELIARLLREETETSWGGDASRSLIERLVLAVRLNGYETGNIYSSGIVSAELGLYASYVDAVLRREVAHELERVFTERRVVFHSQPLVNFLGLRLMAPHLSRALFADIHGEMTDVLLIEDGMLGGVASFPHGTATTRRRLPVSHGEADSLLALTAAAPESPAALRVKNVATAAQAEWADRFRRATQSLMNGQLPPRFIYVLADERVLPLYTRTLESDVWVDTVLSGSRSIVGITPTLLRERCAVSATAERTPASLLLAALAADAFFDRGERFDFLSTNVSIEASSA